MNMKNLMLTVILTIILILVIKFVGLTGYGVYLGFNDNADTLNYNFGDVANFAQCWDSDPINSIYFKGYCHSQYYDSSLKELVGKNSMDFCHSENKVIDYSCSRALRCGMVVSECEGGFSCKSGKCVENNVLLFPKLSKLRV